MFYQYLICKNKSVLCTLEAGLKTGCEIVNEDTSLNCQNLQFSRKVIWTTTTANKFKQRNQQATERKSLRGFIGF
jgi:hypothetical protein